MEVPKSTPTAALFLDLLLCLFSMKEAACILKKLPDRQNDNPVKMICHEMLKYEAERNWANNIHELHSKYSLPLSD